MVLVCLFLMTLPLADERLLAFSLGGLTIEKWLGLLCFAYALGYAARRRPVATWSAPLLAFGGLYIVALVSWLAWGSSAPDSLFWSFGSEALLLLTMLWLVDNREKLRWALLASFASVALISAYTIREWLAGAATAGAGFRPGAMAGDANYFAADVVIALPLLFGFLEHGARWERWFCWGTMLMAVFASTLAASRGGSLGLTAAVLAYVLASRAPRSGKALLVAVILLVSLLAPGRLLTRWLRPTAVDTASALDRTELWTAAWAMLEAHPWRGIGIGQFKSQLPNYTPPGSDLDFIAHNTYLEIAAEMGLPGLGAFLALIGGALLSLGEVRRAAREHGDWLLDSTATGLSAGWLGFMVAGFFISAAFLRLFWLAVSLAAVLPGLAQHTRQTAGPGTQQASARRWPTADSARVSAYSGRDLGPPRSILPQRPRIGRWGALAKP